MTWWVAAFLLLSAGGGDDSARWAAEGLSYTAEQARTAESSLAAKPNDVHRRVALLSYLRATGGPGREAHLLWMVDKQPESGAWLLPAMEEYDAGTYRAVRERWVADVEAHPKRARRLRNVAAFLMVRDRPMALTYLAQAQALEPGLEGLTALQARADALAILGITGLDAYGLPSEIHYVETEADAARERTLALGIGERQCATANALLTYGASLLSDERLTVLTQANEFYSAGIDLDAWAESCRYGRETVAAWQSMRAAGWLPSRAEQAAGAKLAIAKGVLNLHRVATQLPVYPDFAKSHRITGAVLARVRIAGDGHVALVEVLSGPAELQASASEALQGWKFVMPPRTTEVVTVLELRYTMN